tara:strand:+ start:277 stop:690 length:414 start_codon:yes stop_codon:yes gene_type:complete
MYKDILINLNLVVGLILLSLLIFNNVCPVYVGFFFIFSNVFMYVILYEIVYESFNKNHIINRDLKIMLVTDILFMIWGLIILFEDCMKNYIFQLIYIMISVTIYLVLSIVIINKLRKEERKEIEIGILDNYHLESLA